MPLQATSGAASYDAFGGGVPVEPNYIESVFSTYLYAGNSTNRSIVNDIDLSGKGGLVWIKDRNAGLNHTLFDTARGATNYLLSDSTNAQDTAGNTLTAFNSNGFNLGTNSSYANGSGYNYASWTFRKQPKFFDVVTWSGNSVSGRQISHALGSTPGCIIVKCTSTSGDDWCVFHRSLGRSSAIFLNLTSASGSSALWDGTDPTSTNFTVSSNGSVNGTGNNYVAYLFAHDAGGFGLTGTDNVVSCGSFTTDGSGNATVNLGYEPQWVMTKRTNSTGSWAMFDSMRGLTVGGSNDALLLANSSAAEDAPSTYIGVTSTGLAIASGAYSPSATYIYIAIRRGPMRVPTSGTSVFAPVNQNGGGAVTTNFPVDLNINTAKSLVIDKYAFSRLTGSTNYLKPNATDAEFTSGSNLILFDRQNSTEDDFWNSGNSIIYWNFRRAPSFFDEVCWTATGSPQTISHNLGAIPEMMIRKRRDSSTGGQWDVYVAPLGASKKLQLESTAAEDTNLNTWTNTTPTSSVMYMGNTGSGWTFVTYLFATCAGVSKVGSYTGNGSSQTINCGFTAGARFVLIKATSTTGDWMVSDSARGIVSGNDPYLELNNTNAEVTGEDWLDTDSTGFVVNEVSGSNANTNGASYIFLAIA